MTVRRGELVVLGTVDCGSFRSRDLDEVQAFYAQRYGMRASMHPAAGAVDGEFTARWLQAGPLHVLEHRHEAALVLHAHLHGYGAAVALSGAFTLEQAKTQAATGTATGSSIGPTPVRARRGPASRAGCACWRSTG